MALRVIDPFHCTQLRGDVMFQPGETLTKNEEAVLREHHPHLVLHRCVRVAEEAPDGPPVSQQSSPAPSVALEPAAATDTVAAKISGKS